MGSNAESIDARWRAIFEDRHGAGAVDELIAELRRPCVTFADIARRYNVSRERVRQWHLRTLPDAPRGHARQRLCAAYHQRRRLLEEPLFRAFYRHVRPHIAAGRIELVKGSEGYRTRSVRVDQHLVALRHASPRPTGDPLYLLAKYRGAAEFLYYRLTADDYLFLPKSALPAGGATFADGPASRLHIFKNTFAALEAGRRTGNTATCAPDATCDRAGS